jgi:hypothetical protein
VDTGSREENAPRKTGKVFMRRAFIILAALLAASTSARATVGFACNAKDRSATIAIGGAYGTSLGSGMANFGADIEIRLKEAPTEMRNLHLDRSHVSQHWFNGRDLKIFTRWDRPEGEPFGEALLIVEMHRGPAEESPYRGRYTLQINLAPLQPGGEIRIVKASGTVSCGTD